MKYLFVFICILFAHPAIADPEDYLGYQLIFHKNIQVLAHTDSTNLINYIPTKGGLLTSCYLVHDRSRVERLIVEGSSYQVIGGPNNGYPEVTLRLSNVLGVKCVNWNPLGSETNEDGITTKGGNAPITPETMFLALKGLIEFRDIASRKF